MAVGERVAIMEVELFTHPICSGCQEAFNALSKLSHAGVIELRVTNLALPKGRSRASELGVEEVPTVRIGSELKTIMTGAELKVLIKSLSS
jgi:predicted DsbA family dithiol-disulfide isomerase